jgi:predicted nucleotidyltransferase component of viral defense system
MDFRAVRETIIVSLFSDDTLFEKLVLKGGNALNIVHRLGKRTSMDVDFSIPDDFEDLADIEARIFRALNQRFGDQGLSVFDEKFETKPEGRDPRQRWGGYSIEFKLIETKLYEEGKADLDRLRRTAQVVGDGQRRRLRIEISKHEFCDAKEAAELDSYTIFVYSPEMIAIEKLRAICQQMPTYKARPHKTARARDFYDIRVVVTEKSVDLATDEHKALMHAIFKAKEVPLELLEQIGDHREFHRLDWPAVVASVGEKVKDFDYYFEFVLDQVARLKVFWRV